MTLKRKAVTFLLKPYKKDKEHFREQAEEIGHLPSDINSLVIVNRSQNHLIFVLFFFFFNKEKKTI